MRRNGAPHHIFEHNYLEGNDGEEMFGFHETHAFSDTIARVFLIGNCNGYMQLTKFRNKDLYYTNFSAGMQQIIIVYAE